MTTVMSIDVRTGRAVEEVAPENTREQVAQACERAAAAFPALVALGRVGRAAMLREMADALEARRETIVATADRETALGDGRLNGELTRTCFQLRLFADELADGGYLEATIDHAGPTGMGPRPDLRRMLVPLGPVGVFGASNFPLAFSVPGGDTASALAAGCPVVVKAHPSHPATSVLCHQALAEGAASAGAPDATVAIVHGQDAGAALVTHPAITAVGFTGSLRGGRALFDLASGRPDPIPFYGELGSLNPMVVTPAAAAERADAIAEGLAGSFTLGVGQFCTKPGLVFVPTGAAGDALAAGLAARVPGMAAGTMLNAGIRAGFVTGTQRLADSDGVRVLAEAPDDTSGTGGAPVVFEVVAGDLGGATVQECFGPTTVLARYGSDDELLAALDDLDGTLTATLHVGDGETDLPARLARRLTGKAGRVLFNGYPTGVAVSWAMQHGGPWPATTNPLHTSVGTTSIRRFLRPVCYQDAPAALLPAELRDGPCDVPRRVDGDHQPAS